MQIDIFKIVDMLDEEFPNYTFGTNKDGMLFISGQMTDINLNIMEGVGVTSEMSFDQIYNELKKFLLKNKFIKE